MPPKFSKRPQAKTVENQLAVKIQAKMQRAIALHQQGQLVQAQARCEEILKVESSHLQALNLLGMIAAQTKDLPRAADLLSKLIALEPGDAGVYCNLGNVLQGLKQLGRAIDSYDKAIAIKPDYAEAYYARGLALKGLQQLDAAIASYDQAIAFNPSYDGAYYNRGNVLKELGQLEAAVASYKQAIGLNPKHVDAYYNCGVALNALKQFDAAIASYNRVIALRPDDADAYYNRGVALNSRRDLTAAIASYDQAITLKPAYTEVYINRGVALKGLGRLDEAMASYGQALSIKPDNAEGHFNQAILNLLRGDFDRGWAGYEWRRERDSSSLRKNSFSQPLWSGKESLTGKIILLHSEQGLGDTLQFCRYAQLVANLGARVILTVPKSLVSLLEGLGGVHQLVAKGDVLPAFDYHCPLLSLPLAFKTNLNSIPFPAQYLSNDANKVAQWQAKLPEKAKPRVGLVWSGSTTLKNDHNRSIFLSDLTAQLPTDFQYVSLQKEVRDIDLQTLAKCTDILHFESELNDFGDTAALCEVLDVVISVDTSVAHLAGALGKPVWILLPLDPDWRWLLDRVDSPWYSSAKLYRQAQVGDWKSVFRQVSADLIRTFKPV